MKHLSLSPRRIAIGVLAITALVLPIIQLTLANNSPVVDAPYYFWQQECKVSDNTCQTTPINENGQQVFTVGDSGVIILTAQINNDVQDEITNMRLKLGYDTEAVSVNDLNTDVSDFPLAAPGQNQINGDGTLMIGRAFAGGAQNNDNFMVAQMTLTLSEDSDEAIFEALDYSSDEVSNTAIFKSGSQQNVLARKPDDLVIRRASAQGTTDTQNDTVNANTGNTSNNNNNSNNSGSNTSSSSLVGDDGKLPSIPPGLFDDSDNTSGTDNTESDTTDTEDTTTNPNTTTQDTNTDQNDDTTTVVTTTTGTTAVTNPSTIPNRSDKLFASTQTNGRVYLQWEFDSTSAGSYIYYGNESGQLLHRRDAGRTNQYEFTDLTPGKQYFMSVVQYNENGNTGPFGPEVSLIVGNPNSVTGSTAISTGSGSSTTTTVTTTTNTSDGNGRSPILTDAQIEDGITMTSETGPSFTLLFLGLLGTMGIAYSLRGMRKNA